MLDVNTVNLDLAFTRIDKSEQDLKDRALSTACPANNTDLHAGLHLKVKIAHRWLQVFSVLHSDSFKLEQAVSWPLAQLGIILFQELVLGLQLGIIVNSLS